MNGGKTLKNPTMTNDMELKAYKLLAKIRGSILSRIEHEARNKAEYSKDKPEDLQKWMEYFGNPEKWDYCGILKKEQHLVLKTLEYLLDDNATEFKSI